MNKTLSNQLVKKIILTFLLLILVMGIGYIFLTYYFTTKYFEESSQRLNANVASHLIEEKFQNASPFLADGEINKPLFGDIMHDMMAVNRGIEVYLLGLDGAVRYSVVLDHERPEKAIPNVAIAPIEEFIQSGGNQFILGDDPLEPLQKKIFSAAKFDIDGNEGYIYVILASQEFEKITSGLIGSYFLRLGFFASLATLLFTALLGTLVIWYLTKNLREVIRTVERFREGDMTARIENASDSDLSSLALTFNNMADTLVDNIEKLKSVESLRRELVSNVSHDLRTPLAIMQGYIETLQIKSASMSEQQRNEYLKIIQKSGVKLNGLIQQLFEYSKLEAKQIHPVKEPFQISELASDVYLNYQTLAKEKNITIELNAQKGLPLVFGDISLIERILQNLMDNAMKFTPENGKVTIFLDSDNQQVFIGIKDTGPGIPVDQQSFIFERFRKGGDHPKNAGAGLGLAIVKKIIELHESTIDIISKPNQGTTFRFFLPTWNEEMVYTS